MGKGILNDFFEKFKEVRMNRKRIYQKINTQTRKPKVRRVEEATSSQIILEKKIHETCFFRWN